MRRLSSDGFILPGVLAFILAAVITASAVLTVILNNFFVIGNNVNSQQAFNIAEAGINYYLWHMAHNGTDYRDGQSMPATPGTLGYGPYVHTYIDSAATNQGTYTLWVKPQGSGSTVATVRSIGKTKNSNITRTIEAKIGATSFASYGLLADTEFWFGSSETANGPVFSNVGVHMDGPSTDTVQSANASYTPQSKYGGDGGSHSGVWCSNSVSTCATRDKTNWLYPKPTIDFNQVSTSLCTMKTVAFANDSATSALATGASPCTQTPTTRTAAYLPRRSTSSFSKFVGYLIKLNANGTYDLLNVNNETDTATSYSSALSTSTPAAGSSGLGNTNIPIPSSGVIFAEDNVWVLGSAATFHGRVSIAAGQLASAQNAADINIAGPLTYLSKDGSDAIGLVAENNIYVAPYAPPSSGAFNFEVDAATLAGSGSVTYPGVYKVNSDRCTKGWVANNQTFNYYGSVATRLDWTWNFISAASTINNYCGSSDKARDASSNYWFSGIENTTTSYDYNLLYAPPPSYPITGGYNIISWREVLTHP